MLINIPINEETIRLLNSFVQTDVKLQQHLTDMRWDVLKANLSSMHFEDAVLFKMVVINFRMLAHTFDFDSYDEIFDTLNEIEVARRQDTIKGGKLMEWTQVLSIFLQNLAVDLFYSRSTCLPRC